MGADNILDLLALAVIVATYATFAYVLADEAEIKPLPKWLCATFWWAFCPANSIYKKLASKENKGE